MEEPMDVEDSMLDEQDETMVPESSPRSTPSRQRATGSGQNHQAQGSVPSTPRPLVASSTSSEEMQISSVSSPASSLQSGQRKKTPPVPPKDDGTLFSQVKIGKPSTQEIVDQWIEEYKDDQDSGVLKIVQFFISSSGCKGQVTPEMQSGMENAAIIRRMMDEFDEDSADYPLIMTGQPWKKFRTNFCSFVEMLVKRCQFSILYDEHLMDAIISLLTALTDSQVRAFRHTATLAAVKLMTALVEVALSVSVQLDNASRQHAVERKKSRETRASNRLEGLASKRQELQENLDEIKTMLDYVFKSVFVHRYRDVVPEIRAICIAELGVWMDRFPQHFLDDSHLKYVGWMLFDEFGQVRLKCLQALQPILADRELVDKVELFTRKFKDRIVSMVLDKDLDVAVEAVHLLKKIQLNQRGLLTDQDSEMIFRLVLSKHRTLALAVGQFLSELIFTLDGSAPPPPNSHRGKKRSANTPLIRDLIQFFIELDAPELGPYVVDAMMGSNEMMNDWECMTDLLLEPPGDGEEALDGQEEACLIELMTCCVKQAATGQPPEGRDGNFKKATGVKETKKILDDRNRLTEHFIKTLPPLLEKFGTDHENAANLLAIPQHFELGIYSTSRQEHNLDALLRHIQGLAESHPVTEVLENCAKTLGALCSEDHAIYSRCDVTRVTVIDRIADKFRKALEERNRFEEEDPDEDAVYELLSSSKKIAIFYSLHNLGTWDLWDPLFGAIQDAAIGSRSSAPEAIKHCISACHWALLWDVVQLEGGGAVVGTSAERQRSIRDRLVAFIPLMARLFTSAEALWREEAFLSVCDLLVAFSRSRLEDGERPLLRPLVYRADERLQDSLTKFLQVHVFVEDDDLDEEERRAVLGIRRRYLTGYCKLILSGVLPLKLAANVFRHYVEYSEDYDDILKMTLDKTREIDRVGCARTFVQTLHGLIGNLQRDDANRIIRHSKEFQSIKELARRFALSFGPNGLKNRQAVAAFHQDGILLASKPPGDGDDPPPNMPFLEIVAEFSSKLLKEDKPTVVQFLDRILDVGQRGTLSNEWQPLLVYRASLEPKEGGRPLRKASRPAAKGRRGRGKGARDVSSSEESDST